MARVLDGDTDYFDDLFTIGQVIKKNGGHVLLVATKCDLVLERYASFSSFADEQFVAEELLYPDGSGIQSFAEWVTENLAAREQVKELLKLADYDLVHPVYYRTTTTPDGALVPALDDFGALQPVGFDRLADILEEEALSNVRL